MPEDKTEDSSENDQGPGTAPEPTSKRDQLLASAFKIIEELTYATRNAKEKLKKDVQILPDAKLEEWIREQRESKEDPPQSPKQIDKDKPPFTVPLKELDVGKAGVSDLFDKQNEVIRYLNTLDAKPKAQ